MHLLFLDCLHAEVEVADTITTFFVRCCVYFTFFRTPQTGATEGENNRETPRDRDAPPLSLLFVGWNGLSTHDVVTMNKVSHSPWMPDGMRNSKLYPASKHRGEKGDRMSRNSNEDGNSRHAVVGFPKRGNQIKTPWRLNG
ncbi:hypothetical protein GB937_005991 [Aspergillus fischeri]|nr:hypothetical protein GB937_005991 [Aspergillus fischeri]